jgi:hypothetical protein
LRKTMASEEELTTVPTKLRAREGLQEPALSAAARQRFAR